MNIQTLLISLRLKPEAAKVAQLLFDRGALTPTDISRLTGVNRVSTYEYLKHLSLSNIVTQTIQGKRKYYTLSHPRSLKRLIAKHKEEIASQERALHESFGDLLDRFNTKGGKPGVTWFEGIEGIQKMLMDYAEDNISGQVVGFSNTALVEQAYSPKFLKNFIKKKVAHEITARYIVAEPDSRSVDKYLSRFYLGAPKIFIPKVKKLPGTKKFFDTEINIYDDKISFIKIKPPAYFGVIIKSAELANSLRIVFNFMWETISKP